MNRSTSFLRDENRINGNKVYAASSSFTIHDITTTTAATGSMTDMNKDDADDVNDLFDYNKKIDLATMWTAFNKCKSFIKHGQRLENMSWRLWRYNHQQSCAEKEEEEQAVQDGNKFQTTVTATNFNTTLNTPDNHHATTTYTLLSGSPVKVNSLHEVPQQPQQQNHQNMKIIESSHDNIERANTTNNNRTPNILTPITPQHQQQQQQQQHLSSSPQLDTFQADPVLRNATLVKYGKKYIYIVDDDDDDFYEDDDDCYLSGEDAYYDFESDDDNNNNQDYFIDFKKTIPKRPTAAKCRSLLSDLLNKPPSLLLSNSTSSFGTTNTITSTDSNTANNSLYDGTMVADQQAQHQHQQNTGVTTTTSTTAANALASLYLDGKARTSPSSYAELLDKINNKNISTSYLFNWKESFRGW
ncbi:hypothetical protein BDF20DRAFT_831004 [Mycotypha africana]|uniref:uncharacterized protein n=1 Tax=Mycotypha africana TaxID=64632 RepID=UPI0023017A02|nr:uncharacterized protein BDF20DRAFT_831004 [Mycotypha africana]KAI8990914.1 hypothetical protein BDF20DRAFT_831004 [Mycotypha africana]